MRHLSFSRHAVCPFQRLLRRYRPLPRHPLVRAMNIRDLNRLILALAPRDYVAAASAPSTDAELFQHAATGAPMRIWDGASDATIYGDAKVNHAFRAWHDSCHILGRHAFTLEGEKATCELQIRQARAAFPSMPAWIERAIRCEVIGQAEHFAAHGAFPANQSLFFLEHIGLTT